MSQSPFHELHAAMQSRVDRGFLPGVSTVLLRGREVVDRFVCGQADMEAGVPLRDDHIFELGNRQVLRLGATRIDDVEPARRSITVLHLMTHTSGLGYGAFDPGTLLFNAYTQAGVHNPLLSQAQFIQALAPLPLNFHPGEQWEYSLATDVLGRLVEVVSGQSLGEFFQQRICGPLGMVDTDFWVPEAKRAEFGELLQAEARSPRCTAAWTSWTRPSPA